MTMGKQKQRKSQERKPRKRGRPRQRKLAFTSIFEKSIRRKAEEFLESGTPVATLTKGLLIAAALGSVLAIGIMAPNLFKALGMLRAYEKRSKRINSEGFSRVRRTSYHLLKRGFIEAAPNDYSEEQIFQLTTKGKEEVKRILGINKKKIDQKTGIARPATWDGKWRLILFDIPVDFNTARDMLRYGLRSLGCYQIQQSAWVHPFPCVCEIKELTSKLGVKGKIEIYVMENFDHKEAIAAFHDLLKYFKN